MRYRKIDLNVTMLYMQKRRRILHLLVPVFCIAIALIWLNFSHTGRIYGLYIFGGVKAPVTTKISCAKETNTRVYEKFQSPLAFDEESKNALREYWHFSYFRECLFKHGYDFVGNTIKATELVPENGELVYRNHAAGVTFRVPEGSHMVYDNITNPDLDDYLIASLILIKDQSIFVYMDRSYKVDSNESLRSVFAGFTSKKDFPSEHLTEVTSNTPNALSYEDGDMFGYVITLPNHHVVTIFGSQEAKPILQQIGSSLATL